jgi:hypothetical protein
VRAQRRESHLTSIVGKEARMARRGTRVLSGCLTQNGRLTFLAGG